MNSHRTDHNDNSSSSIDIGNVLSGIWERKHWVVFSTMVAAAASIVYVVTASPEYQATARVLVENLETNFSRTDPRRPASNPIGQQEIKSQVEVLHSRDLAKKVVSKLKLTSRLEFDPVRQGIGPVSTFLISIGFKTDPNRLSLEQRALGVYYKKLTAYQIPESKVIVINMKSSNGATAAAVANTLAEEFVSDTRTVQSTSTGRARDWLANQIESLKKTVIASELKAERFRAKAGLLRGRDANSTLSNQELSELNSQIILAEAQRSEIQARAKSIRDLLAKTGSVASSSEVLNSPLIQRLRERQITLEGTIAELSTTYLPNHPRVASVRRAISGLNRQVRAETLKVVSGLEQQAKIATAREASLRASLNGLKTRASGANLDEVELRGLERQAKANRTLLETFLTKHSDASTREDVAAQPGLARIISKADIPVVPSFPKPAPTVALATIGGMFLSLGLAFMASVMSSVAGGSTAQVRKDEKTFDHDAVQTAFAGQSVVQPTVHSAAQSVAPPVMQPVTQPVTMSVAPPVNQPVQMPAPVPINTPSLSQLPTSNSLEMAQANAMSVIQNNNSLFSNGIVPVSSWANSARQTLGIKRIAIVGLAGAEMDTAAACLGLARQLSMQNIRTIIVDVAMQGSQLAAMTQTSQMSGVAELLTGYASFQDVIVKDDYSEVRILRVGQTVGAAWPLLASDRMETILAALDSDNNHDMVLVHGGALAANATIQNGAVTKCHSSLLLVSASQATMVGNAMQNLNALGMHASQYIRIADGGGMRQVPDNVTQINTAHIANAALHAQAQHAQPAAIAYNAPLFSKVAV